MVNSIFQKGVTLIELMITLAILAIVAAVALPAYTNYVKTGKMGECMNEIAAIKLAEEEFFLANNTYFPGAGAGPGAGSIADNSTGLYVPSPEAQSVNRPANCTYDVGFGTTGNIATSYSITATGAGDLIAEGVIATVGN